MKTFLLSCTFIALFGMICQAQTVALSPLENGFATTYALEAAQEFTKAAELLQKIYDPHSYEINLRIGWLLYNAGDYEHSKFYYLAAADLIPTSVEARLGAALPLSMLEQWDQVAAQYLAILKFDSHNSMVNYRLGLIHYNRKNYSAARPYLDAALSVYPFDYSIVGAAAWNYYMMGAVEEAKKLFHRVLLIAPGDEYATDGLVRMQ